MHGKGGGQQQTKKGEWRQPGQPHPQPPQAASTDPVYALTGTSALIASL